MTRADTPSSAASTLARLAIYLARPGHPLDVEPLMAAAARADYLGDAFGPLVLTRAALLGHLDRVGHLDRHLVTALGLVSTATGSLWTR